MSEAEQPHTAQMAPPPPVPNRRPRVREVSSRFMSPLVSSNTTNSTPSETHHRSKSVQRRRHDDSETLTSRGEENIPDTIRRSLDTPKSVLISSINRKHHHHQQHLNQPRSRQKLFKENGDPQKVGQSNGSEISQSRGSQTAIRSSISRPDTPNLMGTDRIVPSRYKQTPGHLPRSVSSVSAATKLLQEATARSSDDLAVLESKLPKIATAAGEGVDSRSGVTDQPRSCPNSPVCVSTNKSRNLTDSRCSKIDGGNGTMGGGRDRNCVESLRVMASPCSRSLDLQASSGDQLSSTPSCWLPFKTVDRSGMGPSRTALKMGVLPLPPHPKLGADTKKGKRGSNQQEDAQSLKLLHNHLLQWRFTNAKAEASMQAQKKEAERQLYTLGSKISDLHDVVEHKRIELARLQRLRSLSSNLEIHMPYLDEWSALEEDYSTSLTGTSNALLNTSMRLPVSGEVRADPREVKEALNSASKVMEMIGLHIQSLLPKAEEVDTLSSELARVSGGERALVEECGSLLFKMQASQVNEWSLRGHLVQLDAART